MGHTKVNVAQTELLEGSVEVDTSVLELGSRLELGSDYKKGGAVRTCNIGGKVGEGRRKRGRRRKRTHRKALHGARQTP
jgi:hypothetical protein